MEANGKTDAIAVYQPATALAAYEPRSIDDAWRLAKIYATSGLCKFKAPEQAFLAMATGAELDIPATTALQAIDVVEGKAALSADLMMALCLRRAGICEKFELIESTAKIATYEVKRQGKAPKRHSFTIEEAATAGLAGKDNWKKYPADMLRHRAASRAARAEFPDITLGLVTPDEAREIQETAPLVENVAPLAEPPDAEIVESIEERAKKWEAALRAATSREEGDRIGAEVQAAIPDQNDATRKALGKLYAARNKAAWAPEA